MKKIKLMVLLGLLAHTWVYAGNIEVGTQFTYQGELLDNGSPANGTYDVSVLLFNSVSGGSQVDEYFVDDIVINNGLLNTTLDYGDAPFDGEELYLEISGVVFINFKMISQLHIKCIHTCKSMYSNYACGQV